MRRAKRPRRAVFLDKDGTLVTNVPYNVRPDLITLAPRADEALRIFHDAGLDIVVVSNQPGVAFGRFEERAMGAVRQRIEELVTPFGVRLLGLYFCPHHPQGTIPRYAVECECRKPRCGLLHAAAADLNLATSESWMVGDILDDIEAGRRAGCRTVLVDNGGETEWLSGPFREPHVVVRDLAAAARIIAEPPLVGAVRPVHVPNVVAP